MAKLVLVRHGKSDWNEKGLWTGWTDIGICLKGIEESKQAGRLLQDIDFDIVYIAPLIRNRQTLDEMKKQFKINNFLIIESKEILERNYGIYTGKNKWQVKKDVGEEEFQKIRRSWDHKIPEGESLKQVYERFIPYYKKNIEKNLIIGKNILIVSSGNALRSLVKYLDKINDEEISHLEIGTGEILVYEIDSTGAVGHKEVRGVNPDKLKV